MLELIQKSVTVQKSFVTCSRTRTNARLWVHAVFLLLGRRHIAVDTREPGRISAINHVRGRVITFMSAELA